MTGAWWGDGAADRAAAASSALDRAEAATTAALRHLLAAQDVDWTGPGAAGYRDELAAALAGVRLLRQRLSDAGTAVAEHAAVVRRQESLAACGDRGLGLALLGVPPGEGASTLAPWPPVPAPSVP